MFEWLKNYLLNQEIKSLPKIQKQFVEWDKVKTAAIITDSSQYSLVKEFVKQSGKNFDIIVFYNDKISKANDSFLSINKKDLNFFGIPKTESIQKLKDKTYDILISTDHKNTWFMKALTGVTQSKCKLGPENTGYSEFFDICIQSGPQDFLKQALKYLMMIKV